VNVALSIFRFGICTVTQHKYRVAIYLNALPKGQEIVKNYNEEKYILKKNDKV
jgi:hypothetical protein